MKLSLQCLLSLTLFGCLLSVNASLVNAEPAIEVAVSAADGKMIRGDLIRITEDGVQIGANSDQLRPNLSVIRFPNLAQQSLPTVVELVGGTKIHVSSVTWDGDRLELTPARQQKIELPVKELRSIRYRPGNSSTDAVWLGWTEDARRGDRLAVRRDARTLDSLDGTVVGIKRDAIRFEMGGNTIDAPIAKLEGVLFSSAPSEPTLDGIRVNDTSGSQYVAQSIELSAPSAALQITLANSIKHSIPLNQLISIQYSGGILQLSNAEVASSRFSLVKNGQPNSALKDAMQTWFSPKAVRPKAGGSDGVIVMSSPGEISFRIPSGYEQFTAAVRRQSDVNVFLPVMVEVLVDGQKQWSGKIENRESRGLELPIKDARLLTLKVSETSADKSDNNVPAAGSLGGSVEWFSGRLLK